jgi:hypothetical protein
MLGGGKLYGKYEPVNMEGGYIGGYGICGICGAYELVAGTYPVGTL